MPGLLVWTLVFVTTIAVIGGLVVGVLWLKRGHNYVDAGAERFVLLVPVIVAASLLSFAIDLDETLLPSVLAEVASAILAGVFVGVVVLVLDRDQ